MTTGIAFIMEGATEKEFYVTLLNYLCTKHHAKLERILIPLQSEVIYRLEKAENEEYIIKFNVVNSVTQLPRAGNWFRSQCIDKYNQMDWHVFLCYDKDEYKEDISKFYEGDWTSLRKKLKKAKTVVDIAASADIEDIML